jgi:3-methyladenine DNA glycosylase AlkD
LNREEQKAKVPEMTAEELVSHLRSLGSAVNREGQRRFGITPQTEQLGIPIPALRKLARAHRRDHRLAAQLWKSAIHEARILAAFVDDPALVTRAQMNRWTAAFDSWDICDQVCGNLFDRTPFALEAARDWVKDEREFVRRAGFALMATAAVHRKDLPDKVFADFLPVIRAGSTDERNFVRKAVNWTLRQIGKRSPGLRTKTIAEARRIVKIDSRAARWIARDALRELTG